jgi:hypothetical protein
VLSGHRGRDISDASLHNFRFIVGEISLAYEGHLDSTYAV